jgi:hypothetical protein
MRQETRLWARKKWREIAERYTTLYTRLLPALDKEGLQKDEKESDHKTNPLMHIPK